jgi:hypothetical protein
MPSALLPAAVVTAAAPVAARVRAGTAGTRGMATPPRPWDRARMGEGRQGDETAPRLASAVDVRPLPSRTPMAAPRPGSTAYGVAAYLAADALRARPRDEAVEVSVRRTADGGRVTVARRTAGDQTVAIEAQIA